jgi:hypothetical protein
VIARHHPAADVVGSDAVSPADVGRSQKVNSIRKQINVITDAPDNQRRAVADKARRQDAKGSGPTRFNKVLTLRALANTRWDSNN